MDEYVVKQSNMSALARCHAALYQETCIINACTEDVVMVDVTGKQRVISPTGSLFSNQTIMIHRRETDGPSLAGNGASLQIPGFTVEIPLFKIKSHPVYVEELNVVLCSKDDAETCRHPHAVMSYQEALDDGLRVMGQRIADAPGIRILANDPTSSCDYVYTLLDSRVIVVPVTHLNDEKFTMTLIVINEGRYFTETFDLSDLLTGTTNMVEFSNRAIPFVTTSRANAETIAKTFKWLNPTTFAEMQTKLKQQHEAEIGIREAAYAAQKAELEAKLKDMSTKLTILNTTLSQVTSERDDFKYKYQYLKGDINATNEMMSVFSNKQKYQASMHMSDNDVEISDTKRQHTKEEATFKTWHLILAAAVPVVCALGIEYFRSRK